MVRFGGGSNIKQSFNRSDIAKKAEEAKKANERTKQERLKQVQMTRRNYRVGEVPDIAVLKKDDVIRTLQKIVQMDTSSAKLILSRLYESVANPAAELIQAMSAPAAPVIEEPKEKARMRRSIESLLDGIKVSRHQSSTFSDLVEALLDVAHAAEVKLNAATVAQTCSLPQCCTFYQGIRSLEKQSMIEYQRSELQTKGRKRSAERALSTRRNRTQVLELADDDLLQLSKLYERLGEKDVVLGLCEKVCKLDETRRALSFELLGEHQMAIDIYQKMMKKSIAVENGDDTWAGGISPSDVEADQWNNGMVKCMRAMLAWEDLDSWIEQKFEFEDGSPNTFEKEVWEEDDDLRDHIRCLVGLCGTQSTKSSELVEFVGDCWLNKKLSDRMQILKSRFGLEASLALLLRKQQGGARGEGDVVTSMDILDAKEMVKKEMERFLGEWGSSDGIGIIAKQRKLRVLQRVVELDEFISCVESGNGAQDLVRAWSSRIPARHDNDHDAWNYILTSRGALLHLLSAQQPEVQDEVGSSTTRLYLSMSRVARSQAMLSVAEPYLRAAQIRGGEELLCAISEAKLAMAGALKGGVPRPDAEAMLSEARVKLEGAERLAGVCRTRESIKYHVVRGQLLGKIYAHHKKESMGTKADRRSVADAFEVALERIKASGEEFASMTPKVASSHHPAPALQTSPLPHRIPCVRFSAHVSYQSTSS